VTIPAIAEDLRRWTGARSRQAGCSATASATMADLESRFGFYE
jgi:hypothetical protein